ncbi:MAG: aminotransferase class I/II-fold pyridoxal phosphate-dependent enzyme [Burkholderiales bacterium]|nr:aminotransferase class I/II-fold pyridoxal phosphate-dependent enzyme [Burkholderiales bacterium]
MKNSYSNLQKMVSLSTEDWDLGKKYGVIDIVAHEGINGQLVDQHNHSFFNMVSCSYLNLDRHPTVIQGIKDAVEKFPQTNIISSRVRIRSQLLYDTEADLSKYFDATVILGTSCSAVTEGILPLLASGVLTENIKPKVIFDRLCHFSMNVIKPICADETEVVTCKHNDIEFIENECKNSSCVVYVCDGAYSTGGFALVKELTELQKKYNLYVYYDDSHALSVYGDRGYGYVRSIYPEINKKTIIVYSLAKAFGAGAGGIAMLSKDNNMYAIIQRYAGPLLWSQPISTAVIGAIRGSLQVHKTSEFSEMQARIQNSIIYFDNLIKSDQNGSGVPIRFIVLGEANTALEVAREVYKQGFYVSPLFFPVVAKGRAGLRMMINNSLPQPEFQRFCNIIKEVTNDIP